jgi:hypothetical protein
LCHWLPLDLLRDSESEVAVRRSCDQAEITLPAAESKPLVVSFLHP